MQRDSMVQVLLVAMVSVPGYLIGTLLREGRELEALQVGIANVLMVLIAGAIMHLRQRD